VWVPQIETNLFNNPLAEVLKPTFIGRPREELAGFEQLGKVTGSIQDDIGNKDNHKEKVGYENLPLDGGVVVVVWWWWCGGGRDGGGEKRWWNGAVDGGRGLIVINTCIF